ncbi:ubiquitin-like small modifier protein 1 [Natronosalvus vescus]|uniref:ubiquitin-like small modifier protein 1 n=1 Tax=Natronosalvus vescus TaxID=2953881 RepID=UPI002091C513|nr:ubiquitin-like small modifier protein 1 [Natronosalvus vescus]
MAIEWKLFADLAEHAGDRTVTVDVGAGDTVGDALEALLADRSALSERVLEDEHGELRSQINVLRNGKDVRSQEQGLETKLEEDDELALFPPVSGGSQT